MTLEEYAQIVSNWLIIAHNNKDMPALMAAFKEADQTLKSNHANPANCREFWEKVRKVVDSGRLRTERQSNSALIVLMQTIEKEIAERTGTQTGNNK